MRVKSSRLELAAGLLVLLTPAAGAPAAAGDAGTVPAPVYVEVTTSRIPEHVDVVPASVTVISGEELRNRGAVDLRSALSFTAGIDISPGGDGGSASSVPEFWGLREFDAFLLVVDGVPWGGAFNPSLATIDLADVERIEVLRGAAPVMYGATSFVGVIQILRRGAASGETSAAFRAGSYGSGALSGSTPLPAWGRFTSRLTGTVEQQNQRDDRTSFDRGRLLWRGGLPLGTGQLHFDADATWIGQDPSSPHPRVGTDLTYLVPLDSNHNPDDSHLRERRLFFAGGYERPFGSTGPVWSSTLAFTRSDRSDFRGFLTDVVPTAPNANGFRLGAATAEIYFDSHVEVRAARSVRIVAGVDHLHGLGTARGGDFDYFVPLDGQNPPSASQLPSQADVKIRDRREFAGAYGFVEWTPIDRWLFELGARLNRTSESRSLHALEFPTNALTAGEDRREVTRGSGSAGITWTAWRSGANALNLYASYRDTYKPAAIDFGLDSEIEILEPETAQSSEAGVKGSFIGGKLRPEVSVFTSDLENLVVTQNSAGVPMLTNAGKERLRGAELQVAWAFTRNLQWRGAWSFHDATFRDFVTDFGGVATQLSGNRVEMSARTMGGTGLFYSPDRGWIGSGQVNIVGNRYLNKRNTALAPSYAAWSGGVGYRTSRWEYRLDGTNLSDQRPPVAESELGDGQYYRLPPLRVVFSVGYRFSAGPAPASSAPAGSP